MSLELDWAILMNELLEISKLNLARVRGGEIVSSLIAKGHGSTELIAHVAFQSAPEAVWAVLDDVENYVNTMPHVKRSEVLERHSNGLRMILVIDTPFPLPDVTSIYESIHTKGNGMWKRQWNQVNKGFMPNSGSWTLMAMPEQSDATLAEYRVRVDPRIPIPKRVMHFAHKRLLPELFGCVEKHAAAMSLSGPQGSSR